MALIRTAKHCEPEKAFIRELDWYAESVLRVEKGIWHSVAFRTFRSRKEFSDIWDGRLVPDEPEVALATRLLSNHDDERMARLLVRIWWLKHGKEADESKLEFIIMEALHNTDLKRQYFRTTKEESRVANRTADMRFTSTNSDILKYLADQPCRPADIAAALGKNRKSMVVQLGRLYADKKVVRDKTGLYSLASHGVE